MLRSQDDHVVGDVSFCGVHTTARGDQSVFCDEHHREQLVECGLISNVKVDLNAVMRQRCAKLVRGFEERCGITRDELCCFRFDRFIHNAANGGATHWRAGVESLPHDVLVDLLHYARAHPEPRVFYPRSADPVIRRSKEEAALRAQAELIALLEDRVNHG